MKPAFEHYTQFVPKHITDLGKQINHEDQKIRNSLTPPLQAYRRQPCSRLEHAAARTSRQLSISFKTMTAVSNVAHEAAAVANMKRVVEVFEPPAGV